MNVIPTEHIGSIPRPLELLKLLLIQYSVLKKLSLLALLMR